MFRLLSSGLPKDPVFPADLKALGYFINSEDEIRSVQNPRAYFKFFLTKNERYNEVQREAMNSVIRDEVHQRLFDLGLEKIRLPLGAQDFEPHVPIFISANIKAKKRVIILFYEHTQDLGIFAHRILGGKGGINKGSAVNYVKYIQSLASGPDDKESPGIIIANMGQLRWWRRGKKAVTQCTWFSLPQKSAVHRKFRFDERNNTVPGNRNTEEHVDYVFNDVAKEMLDPKAAIDVIGVSDGAVQVQHFLNKEHNWKYWGSRLGAVALLSPFYYKDDITNEEFAAWLRKRGRAYAVSTEPSGIAIAGPSGSRTSQANGCPTYSIGEPYYSELMLPQGFTAVLDWLQEVHHNATYENPDIFIFEPDSKDGEIDAAQTFKTYPGPEWVMKDNVLMDNGCGLSEDGYEGGSMDGEAGSDIDADTLGFQIVEVPRNNPPSTSMPLKDGDEEPTSKDGASEKRDAPQGKNCGGEVALSVAALAADNATWGTTTSRDEKSPSEKEKPQGCLV